MKPYAYFLFAFTAGIGATAGSDILAKMDIAGDPLSIAAVEHARYALSGWGGTIYLLAPFLAVGSLSAAFHKRERTRTAMLIFALGIVPLIYFYFEGYQASQQALADERWTAAALSIGFLPIAIGVPVLLLVAAVAVVALGIEERKSV